MAFARRYRPMYPDFGLDDVDELHATFLMKVAPAVVIDASQEIRVRWCEHGQRQLAGTGIILWT